MALVRKYTRARKLTARMLNELVERIEVYYAEKMDGKHVQRNTIYYNCIGAVDIPDELDLPAPEVVVNTRIGHPRAGLDNLPLHAILHFEN